MKFGFGDVRVRFWFRLLPALMILFLIPVIAFPSASPHFQFKPQHFIAGCQALATCEVAHKSGSGKAAHAVCNSGSGCFAAVGAVEGILISPRVSNVAAGWTLAGFLAARKLAPPLPPPIAASSV